MAAIINWRLVMHQRNIDTIDDINKFNNRMELLKYTPYVDLALAVICSIGAIIALNTPFLAPVLWSFAAVFFISGAVALLRKSQGTLSLVAKVVNDQWNLQVELARLKSVTTPPPKGEGF